MSVVHVDALRRKRKSEYRVQATLQARQAPIWTVVLSQVEMEAGVLQVQLAGKAKLGSALEAQLYTIIPLVPASGQCSHFRPGLLLVVWRQKYIALLHSLETIVHLFYV